MLLQWRITKVLVYWGLGFLAFINWNKGLFLVYNTHFLTCFWKRRLRRESLPAIMGFKLLNESQQSLIRKLATQSALVCTTRWGWVMMMKVHKVFFILVSSHVKKSYRACKLNRTRGHSKGCLFSSHPLLWKENWRKPKKTKQSDQQTDLFNALKAF